MSINDLLGEHTPSQAPRLTPRSPLSIKELTAILVLGGIIWAAYDKMSAFAKSSAVEKVVEVQWQMRLEQQHDRDDTRAALVGIKEELQKLNVKVDTVPKRKP